MKEFLRNLMGISAIVLLAYCVGSALALVWYFALLVISA